jgi:hypothetical protein
MNESAEMGPILSREGIVEKDWRDTECINLEFPGLVV